MKTFRGNNIFIIQIRYEYSFFKSWYFELYLLRQNLYNPTEYYQICIIRLNFRQLLIHFSYIKFPNKQNIVANKSCHMAIATETLEHSHIIITRAKVKKHIFIWSNQYC